MKQTNTASNAPGTALPILYHRGKGGALYQWQVWTEGPLIKSCAGQVGGQLIESCKEAEAKNTGRANATTAEEQAKREAAAMHKKKLDKKYALTPEKAKEVRIAPMLAQKFEEHGHKVTYPADLQRKLNGARSLAYKEGGDVVLQSRGNLYWDAVPHINEELSVLRENDMLDGELYKHGVPLQTLCNSWMKKRQPESATIEYHVYDMPRCAGDDDAEWIERRDNLDFFFKKHKFKHIRLVETRTIYSEEDVVQAHQEVTSEGYEGAMVRTHSGLYIFGYRSYDLLKVKSFEDAEYEVVGFTSGVGKDTNRPIWICALGNGKTFKARQTGPDAEAADMFANAESYIGRMLTVKFFEYTADGKPFHPVAIAFRPDEDLGK